MAKILLEIVTPDKLLLSKEVDEVTCPGTDGEFGVLPGHCQFLSSLHVGELKYRVGDETHYMTIMWGYADVTPARVTVRSSTMRPPVISTSVMIRYLPGFVSYQREHHSPILAPAEWRGRDDVHRVPYVAEAHGIVVCCE